jgi:hypothetical protein
MKRRDRGLSRRRSPQASVLAADVATFLEQRAIDLPCLLAVRSAGTAFVATAQLDAAGAVRVVVVNGGK